jgi:hypothetical protein|mmetsp:Transcript_1673/g.3009  ORF Transcript_1673/g.3009 Transcript_1673/m.3009 type:complete len:429 (-) Transcript_1673:121-1407(-)
MGEDGDDEKKAGIENELWNIYTFYTLHGNPLCPEFLKNQQFMKLAKDCQMIKKKQGVGLTSADLSVVFASETQRKKAENKTMAKRANPNLMTYSEFLNVLMVLAPKVYPKEDPDTVFQKLLLENILPLAAHRIIHKVSIADEEGVEELLTVTFKRGLEDLFDYYSDVADRRRKLLAAQEVQDTVKLKGGHGQVQVTSKQRAKELRDSKGLIGYSEFMNFCQDFKLIALSQVTTIQAGDIFLSSVGEHHGGDSSRDMSFEQFYECLLRLALTAHAGAHPEITTDLKLKALLLFMWKAVNTDDASAKAVNGRGTRSVCDASKSVKSGDLNLYGSSQFNLIMQDVWAKDGFREYLQPIEEEGEDGQTVLDRMLNTDGTRTFSFVNEGITQSFELGSPSVVSSTVSTSALGKLLQERPSIVQTLVDSLKEEY